jgi:transposase
MSIVGAFDVHRRQLTFDYLDTVTGEVSRGRVVPADRDHLREWLGRFAGQDDVHFAVEGCIGWRYVTEELAAAGIEPHLAEPADTAALRGRKRHAKTDKTDSRHIRSHLAAGDLPECWIPPGHVLEARAVVRLYKDLLDERGGWHQRIAATLFHQGVPVTASMCTEQGRAAVAGMDLSPAGRQAVETGLRQISRLTGELDPLRRQPDMISRRQPGCRALRTTQYGIGERARTNHAHLDQEPSSQISGATSPGSGRELAREGMSRHQTRVAKSASTSDQLRSASMASAPRVSTGRSSRR